MLIDPSQIRVLGPLSAFAAGFADDLAHEGYTQHSARFQMRLMAQLSRWLALEGARRRRSAHGRGRTISACPSCRWLHAASLDQSDAADTRLPARPGRGTTTVGG